MPKTILAALLILCVWCTPSYAGALDDACYISTQLADGRYQSWDLNEEEMQKIEYLKALSPKAVPCCRRIGDEFNGIQPVKFKEILDAIGCLKRRVPSSMETKIVHVIGPDFVKVTNGNRFKLAGVSVTKSAPALAWLKENIEGKKVFLIAKSLEGERFMHVRIFRDEDGLYINEEMSRQGLASYDPAALAEETEGS